MSARRRSTPALPGHEDVDGAEGLDEEVVDVEVVGTAGLDGVDEGGVGRRHRGGLHDLRPVEEKEQQKDAHHGKDGVDEDALEEVGDHHRDLAAEEGEGEGDGQRKAMMAA